MPDDAQHPGQIGGKIGLIETPSDSHCDAGEQRLAVSDALPDAYQLRVAVHERADAHKCAPPGGKADQPDPVTCPTLGQINLSEPQPSPLERRTIAHLKLCRGREEPWSAPAGAG